MRTPAFLIAAMSMMFSRSRTYASRKSYSPRASPSRSLNGVRFTPSRPPAISSFARSAIQPVASVSAGPPFGGLYLKPPSRGGLWLGVTTMPSERPGSSSGRPRLYARIAWLRAGVGTHESRASTRTSMPFATSTSIALRSAGSDSPCVSRPRNSGPAMPWPLR